MYYTQRCCSFFASYSYVGLLSVCSFWLYLLSPLHLCRWASNREVLPPMLVSNDFLSIYGAVDTMATIVVSCLFRIYQIGISYSAFYIQWVCNSCLYCVALLLIFTPTLVHNNNIIYYVNVLLLLNCDLFTLYSGFIVLPVCLIME